ncbi:PF14351 domain protein [Leptospira fainei serovar Hurstbridge str. BUT 6]|uniref:PF14351 domain protein n=1 Tax=Leptospira fainei serovar Hurstbridge str. BUT 6 TaxID=1193011 RepID=S3VZL5_9LEPT|nr:DUF4401 domain-containing protein [Leptospira fainei]EPG73512.1 PF14351 domain protein [Leptospira fainei serovar Hurstbridge str. BUT 6]
MNLKEITIKLNLNQQQEETLNSFFTRSKGDNAPWYVHLVVIIGSWFAASLILLFLFLAEILKTTDSLKYLGGIVLLGSIAIPLLDKERKISEPLLVSLGFLGQILFFLGIAFSHLETNTISLTVLIVETILYFLSGTWIQRFISVILFFSASGTLLYHNEVITAIHFLLALAGVSLILLFRFETELITYSPLIPKFFLPTVYALAFCVSGISSLSVSRGELLQADWRISGAIGIVVLAAYLQDCFRTFMKEHLITTISAIAGISIILLSTLQAPGISFSVLLILIGFRQKLTFILVLGLLSITGYLTDFYYSLKMTLLVKSYVLLGSGILFISAYLLLTKLFAEKDIKE